MKRKKQEEEAKTIFIKTTKSARYIDPVLFHAQIDRGMSLNQKLYPDLLGQDKKTLDPEAEQTLLDANENLFQRFMHRASMFAMHRLGVTKEDVHQQKKRLGMEPVLADFELAWKTLEMDAN